MISVPTAKAGIVLTGLKDDNPQPCTETKTDSKTDWGIVLTGFTGIVLTGFTGIVLTGAVDTQTECGIIMHD